jgi:L-fucose mutarotase/ribose pyranase (RbsD/FucU family)
MNEIAIEQPTPIIIYSSYTPAQAKAIKKYRENNKKKVNELQLKYYNELKKDETFCKKHRELSRINYYKKKNDALQKKLNL